MANMTCLQKDLLRDHVQLLDLEHRNRGAVRSSTSATPAAAAAAPAAAAAVAVANLLTTLRQAGALPSHTSAAAVTAAEEDDRIQACSLGHLNPRMPPSRRPPRASLLLQYFRGHSVNMPLFLALNAECDALLSTELLVNVDSPQDLAAWGDAAAASGGRVVAVLSDNIHEIRAYNRLLSLARGEFVILFQDDDAPPTAGCASWLPALVRAFERWPDVGVFGLRTFQMCCCYQSNHDYRRTWFEDPLTGEGMHFAQRVAMAPVAFRRAALEDIGGMDETLSEPGMCGITADWGFSHALWLAGWQVAFWKRLRMVPDGLPGGTHRSGGVTHRCWNRQANLVAAAFSAKMDLALEDEMCLEARRLNLQLLRLADPDHCPYVRHECVLGQGPVNASEFKRRTAVINRRIQEGWG